MSEVEKYIPEGAEEFVAPETASISIKPAENEAETMEPLAQSYSSKLAEYLTGMRPEDPAMIDKLSSDQEIIRAKYHLPSHNLPLAEFERGLKKIAKTLNVEVRPRSDCGKFFEENEAVGAVYFDETNKIGMDIDRIDEIAYFKSLGRFEHELIHAIQAHDTPSMPIELMEYEAYLAGANIEFLTADPEAINDILFGFFIGGSVGEDYRMESERRGEEVVPVWNRPTKLPGAGEGLPEQPQPDSS